MLAIVPTFGYKPSTGFTIGAMSNLAKHFGHPKTTRISSAVIGVSYVNTTTAADRQTGETLFDGFATGGGIGLRVLFNKRSSTNLCIDYAWGRQGSKGLYLGLQEAF